MEVEIAELVRIRLYQRCRCLAGVGEFRRDISGGKTSPWGGLHFPDGHGKIGTKTES